VGFNSGFKGLNKTSAVNTERITS